MEPSSLSHSKSLFLTQQIRLLSTPLQPSSTFTSGLHSTDSTLSPKHVTDIVSKTNNKINSHNKLVFSTQTQRHIVEQIESLYFSDALNEENLGNHHPQDSNEEEVGELVAIERDADLTSTSILGALPEELQQSTLHDVSDLAIDEDDADEYFDLRRQLLGLCEQRDAAREKLLRYQKLQELLRPFEDASESVQPNLVTKDGEMRRELERLRVLLARVTGRVGEIDGLSGEGAGVGVGREQSRNFDERLRTIMEMNTT